MYTIGVIAVAIFVACLFGALFNVAVEWHDAWQFRRWQQKHDAMTLDERIAAMSIKVD
jgi:predicted small integral membrane protein